MITLLLCGLACTSGLSPEFTVADFYSKVKRNRLTDAEITGAVQWLGGKNELVKGANPKVDNLLTLWAVQAESQNGDVWVESIEPADSTLTFSFPGHSPRKHSRYKLRKFGNENLYIGAEKLTEGDAFRWQYFADGKPVGGVREIEAYTMPPESVSNPGVPHGTVKQQPKFVSKLFGNTAHDWWIYEPANLDKSIECNLVVFQDGQWAVNYAPNYFDNLIARHDLAPTIVIFVTPGTFEDGKSDRSREYDTLSDLYSRFLTDELLPIVESRYKISNDPMKRCVAGLSSGGICSFTVAWSQPAKFGLVLSWIGSFANIASGDTKQSGGHNYAALVRKTDRKPIRIWMQDGSNDLNNQHGNWPIGNLALAQSLEFAHYDYKAIWGRGFHSDKQGRATLSDALRWLFRKS